MLQPWRKFTQQSVCKKPRIGLQGRAWLLASAFQDASCEELSKAVLAADAAKSLV